MIKRIVLFMYSINILSAVDAMPGLITVHQPDGNVIQCFIKGDEWASWYENPEGYTITKVENGTWVYAIDVKGRFVVPGNRIVGMDAPPTFIRPSQLRPEPEFRPNHTSSIQLSLVRADTFNIPVIYFQFPDMSVTHPIANLDRMFNQEGYGHPGYSGSGSFREFYEEISNNQFSPHSSVNGVYTAPHNHDYYANSGSNYSMRVRQLVRAMVDSLEANGFDWSIFDNDGNGSVDGLILIHAGQGAEQGNDSNIWSHQWNLGGLAVNYDGVTINNYSINPEIQGTNITAIGVIAHEFGHILGLPDLYDTDYSSAGAGKLALMGSGSWGTSGNTPWYPSSMNAWSKTKLNWTNVVELITEQNDITIEQSYTNNMVYRVNHPNDNSEYWLVENRQKVGTDNLMPQPGLLFWHIDTEKTFGWGVNDDEPHYGVGLVQADGLFELENNGGSDGGDPYPGLTDNRELSHCTVPSTISYYGESSMIAFKNISDPDSMMAFDLSFSDIETGTMTAVGYGDAYAVSTLSISMVNNTAISELSFEFVQHPHILTIETIAVAGRAGADSIIVNDEYIELVNPDIPAGSGEILTLTVFANTGSGNTVNVEAKDIIANDFSGSQVCFTFDPGSYLINPIWQRVSVDTVTAASGSSALIPVNLSNTIPIRMMMITLVDSPDRLVPMEEFFTDQNNNSAFDEGEPFEDFNGDGEWTPIVQTTDRTANWNLSYQLSDIGIMVAGLNSIDSIAIGDGPIFEVNVMVDGAAPSENVNLILQSVNLTDIYGNYNLEYEATNSIFTIISLGVENNGIIPVSFSMSSNYPNPFNPVTHVDFTIPELSLVSFTIYSLLGQEVMSMTNEYQPGSYTLSWAGRDQTDNVVPSGVYILQMESGEFLQTRKLVLLK